ncbi:MAG TPA: glycosyltransferase family A protein [Candidatus Xenobia bacterium]|jgi:glycosyltransferase involved in cell wall biosynthesis
MTACISLVMPVHNGARYLSEAIDSALDAGRRPDEIIVVDDASTDETAAVARQFNSVRYLRHERQLGAGLARHHGIELARGDLLAFLDADDRWRPHRLALQESRLAAEAELAGVFGMLQQFISPELDPSQVADLQVDTSPQPAWSPCTLLLRRSAYERAGPFSDQYRVGEFIDWCLRAQEAGCRFDCLPEVVADRRIHLTNHGRTQRAARQDYARVVMAALRRRREIR